MSDQDAIDLANAHHQAGRLGEAEALYRDILRRDPKHAEALHMLGVIALQVQRFDLAENLLRQAIAISPGHAPWYDNLGVALLGQGKAQEAIAAGRAALKIQPHVSIYVNLARALLSIASLDEALVCARKAVALDPNYPPAHWNLGLVLLSQGKLKEGWPQYAWRLRGGEPVRQFRQPRWEGGDVRGKRILLHAEQGIGDTLQFVRYVPQLLGRGAKVIVECQPQLRSLLHSSMPAAQFISSGQPGGEFDAHCSLLDLPGVFGTTLENIPATPYVTCDVEKSRAWQMRLANFKGLKVGVVWAGRPEHVNDRNRSVPLAALREILDPQVNFFSLQKGPAAERARSEAAYPLIDWTDELYDFADTAALVNGLDLVISVDTAIAHLAGAMGRPVWVLLPFAPDWRWMLEREDSPWYPSMRLFRQREAGEWSEPISRVRQALQDLVGRRG